MRIFLTGATGLVGRRLVVDRLERGDQVVLLSRDAEACTRRFAAQANPHVTVIEGNPAIPGDWQQAIDSTDVVIHLAGAGIADRRWTKSYKKLLIDSRVDSTFQVTRAIDQADHPPTLFLCASAIGYYGETGASVTDETGAPGIDFLARLVVRWEEQAIRAASDQTRVVRMRFGHVLDERGGMLGRLLTPFRLGVGGRWGSGRQYMPWIHWRDLIGLMDAVIDSEFHDVVNAVAPEPVTVREFARVLGRALRRPAMFPAPAPVLRMVLGELSESAVMSSRIVSSRIESIGYRHVYPDLPEALRSLVARTPPVTAPEAGTTPSAVPDGHGSLAPIRLVAIGVEGTLLRSDGAIPKGVMQACRLVQRSGAVIVLATSRPPRGMHAILQSLDLVSPVINYNGALIWNPLDQCAQYHEALSGDVVGEVINVARAAVPALLIGLERLDKTYADRLDPALGTHALWASDPDYVGPLEENLHAGVTRLEFAGTPEQIEAAVAAITPEFWKTGRISLIRPDAHLVHIAHPLADKGVALQRIAARLGTDRSQVMAIGDADNDLGMLDWAGLAVGVGNCSEAVRGLVDHVVPGNDDLGVARALQRFVLSRSGSS